MTWTYSDALIKPRDVVRVMIGDVLSDDPQLSDEALDYWLTQYGSSTQRTAIKACQLLAARYSREVDRSIGDANLREGDRAQHYRQLERTLRQELALGATPLAGGIGIAARDTAEADTDRLPPFFTRERFDAAASRWADADDDEA